MDNGVWFTGLACAALCGGLSIHPHARFFAIYCGFMCIGFWLEGLAQVIKDKQA